MFFKILLFVNKKAKGDLMTKKTGTRKLSGIVTLKGKSQEKSVSTKNKAGQSGSKIKTVFCNDFLHGFCIDVKTSSSFRTKTWRPGNNLFYYQGRIPVPKPRVINVLK